MTVASHESPAFCPVDAPASGRDVGIDALRGFAVITMVGANMVPYLLDEPYPFWLRVFASLAAPTFVLLSGFMVGHASVVRPRPLTHYLKRAGELLLLASLIDWLIWGVTPFSQFDILYLIALLLPVAHAAQRLPRAGVLALAATVFVATLPLQRLLGYGRDVPHPVLDRLQALLVDGWFPVFPWLGIGLVGAVIGALRREQSAEVVSRVLGRVALVCLATGVTLWWLSRPELPTRMGYAELFYPPTLAFIIVALGVDLWLVALILRVEHGSLFRLLAVYGRASLLLYVMHLAGIVFVIDRWVEGRGWSAFLATYAAHAVVLWWFARVVPQRLRRKSSAVAPAASAFFVAHAVARDARKEPGN